MGRPRLTATFVRQIKRPGVYGDGRGGHGLQLVVQEKVGGGVRKSWVQRIRVNGRVTNIGLGPTWDVGLAEARDMALENHRSARRGIDPRRPDTVTFAEALEEVIDAQRPGWKGDKTERIWRSQLANYCGRLMGMGVDAITAKDIQACLKDSSANISKNNRQRIGAVMKWAVVEGYRADDPTASIVLPRNGDHTKHLEAMPHSDVAAAIDHIRAFNAHPATKLALEFLILTAARSGEVAKATWDEIDGDVWTVPAEHSKTSRPHRVPLSHRAMEIVAEAREMADGSGLVFPSPTGKVHSSLALRRLTDGLPTTVHGFRSAFRSWAAEHNYPKDIAELALNHVNKDRIEAAYQRSDLMEKRAAMMDAWAKYLIG